MAWLLLITRLMTRRPSLGPLFSLLTLATLACGGTATLADIGALDAGVGGSVSGAGGSVAAGGGGAAPFNPGGITLPVGPGGGGAAGAWVVPTSPDGGAVAQPPTPVVIDGCAALCAKEATVTCPAQQTVADCRAGCSLALASPNCSAQTEALFACAKTATAACGSDGKATLAGCEGQALESGGCFIENAVDPKMSAPCATYCAKVAQARCPNDGTPADCSGGCSVMGNLFGGCGPNWTAYIACANSATVSCGSDGKAAAPACAPEAFTFLACATTLYRDVTAPSAP